MLWNKFLWMISSERIGKQYYELAKYRLFVIFCVIENEFSSEKRYVRACMYNTWSKATQCRQLMHSATDTASTEPRPKVRSAHFEQLTELCYQFPFQVNVSRGSLSLHLLRKQVFKCHTNECVTHRIAVGERLLRNTSTNAKDTIPTSSRLQGFCTKTSGQNHFCSVYLKTSDSSTQK